MCVCVCLYYRRRDEWKRVTADARTHDGRDRACFVGEIQSPEVNLTEFERDRGFVSIPGNIYIYIYCISGRRNITASAKHDRFFEYVFLLFVFRTDNITRGRGGTSGALLFRKFRP